MQTWPANQQEPPLHERQAALFRLLGSPAPIGIIRCLGDADELVLADLETDVDADPDVLRDYVSALLSVGALEAHHDGAETRYRATDIRMFQLLELATEILLGRRPPPPGVNHGRAWIAAGQDQLASVVDEPER